MKRGRQASDEPRLFDFPLDAPTTGEAPPPAKTEAPPAGPRRAPQSLFGEDFPAEAEPEPEPRSAPAAPRPAPLLPRLKGGLTDLSLHLAVLLCVLGGLWAAGVPVRLAAWPPVLLFLLAFSFLYHVLPLAFWGCTPGMALFGVRARNGEDEPLEFGQTVLRWLGALLTVALAGLPLLLALTGRGLSDRLSGSLTWLRAPR